MIVLDFPQGSYEWQQERLGIPTASCFDKILTPSTLKPSKSVGPYRNQLVAEWLLGAPTESFSNAWMERGTEFEPEARAYYELIQNVSVRQVGLILRDDRNVGGSPDGLVGDNGGLELKCPAPQTHVGYMLNPDALAAEYRFQVQGNLYLSGREWWEIMSYFPGLPEVLVRIERDDKVIAALATALDAFVLELNAAKEKLAPHRIPSELEAAA